MNCNLQQRQTVLWLSALSVHDATKVVEVVATQKSGNLANVTLQGFYAYLKVTDRSSVQTRMSYSEDLLKLNLTYCSRWVPINSGIDMMAERAAIAIDAVTDALTLSCIKKGELAA